MRRKLGIILIVLGLLLIAGSAALLLYNQKESDKAGEAAQNVLSELQVISAQNADLPASEPVSAPEIGPSPIGMPVVAVDGYDYIGYLSLPTLGIELPVMAEWSYPRLRIAPCRQFGTIDDNDLVIAAHSYRRHFGTIGNLTTGDPVTFTNMNGTAVRYTVDAVDIFRPTDIDDVRNSPWDLVLYTCTYDGRTRIVVGCNRVE